MSDDIIDIEYRDGVECARVVHEVGSPEYCRRKLMQIDAELAGIDRRLDRDREDQWAAIQKIADAVGAGDVIPASKKNLIERKNALRLQRSQL